MPFANIPVATTVVDSILFRDAFGTPAMRAVFCDHALIERYVEVEIALARAEGRTGVIPAAAAEEIAALYPKVMGSACCRCVRPAIGVSRYRFARSPRMRRSSSMSAETRSRAARTWRTFAVSMMSCVVAPQ